MSESKLWSVDIEQVVLGSCLRDNVLIDIARSEISEEAFYDPLHQRIFAAMLERRSEGLLTPRTLYAFIHDDPGMDDVGGLSYLENMRFVGSELAPIRQYAAILREFALKRYALQDMEDAIWSLKHTARPVAKVIAPLVVIADQAAQAETRARPSLAEDIARKVMEQAERAAAGHRVPSVTTGLRKFDYATGGMQAGDFIVIPARSGMGKSRLLSGMSYRAAAAGHPALVFSLEMMARQWVESIIADVDYDDAIMPIGYGQFRSGSLSAEQLDRAARAAMALTNLPLEIVDAGDVTVEDIGARARAFKAKYGGKLGVILIDYIQRIQPSSHKDRSREQEVSHISRSLKNLAKVLEWPVVAAAQLLTKGGDPRTANREQIPTLAAIRECVAGGTRVVAADSGKPIRVDELKGGDRILGLSNEDKIVAASVSAIWKTGVKTVFKITTRSGRMLRATANHPVLTARGYIEVSALRDDDVVVSPFRLPPCTFEKPERADLCRLLGYMIGDGTMQKGKTPGLIAPDSAVFEDACSIIRTNFPLVDIKLKSNGFNDAWFPQGGGTRKQYGNQLTEWLRLIGILGARDYTKFVPEFVFEAGKSGARNFLAGYLASDGCVKKDRINFDTTSYKLALDVQHLLCLVGIPSTIGRGSRSLMATRDIYRIQVASEFRVKFCEEIKTVGARGTKLRQLLNGLASRPPLTRNSLMNLPRSATEDAAWAAGFKNQGKRLSRRHCLKLATDTGDPVLHIWANSDVIWDGIRSIENVGEEMVYDLEVPETGNFIADGICVHNSGQIEMDADIIMAPHRKAWFLRKEKPIDSPDDSPEMVQWRGEYRACKNILHGYGLKMRHGGEFDLDLWCDMRSSVVRDEEPRLPLSAEDRNARDLLEGI